MASSSKRCRICDRRSATTTKRSREYWRKVGVCRECFKIFELFSFNSFSVWDEPSTCIVCDSMLGRKCRVCMECRQEYRRKQSKDRKRVVRQMLRLCQTST